MELTLDLHSHSGYSGGVGQIDLSDMIHAMELKGLDIFGTGDAFHPAWGKFLKTNLKEIHEGLFSYQNLSSAKLFMLQSEIIVSFPMGKNKRKSFHLLILLPDFHSIDQIVKLFEKWEVKNTIGRPFLVCDSLVQLAERLAALKEINPMIEIIPAHVMTPQGVFGSVSPVDSLEEAFGSFSKEIKIIETGLSADPEILEMIPELKDKTFISNSDCHSSDLRRIGREYTKVRVKDKSYSSIIHALRNDEVVYTGEFSVSEGRFFLTGHRKGKKGHEESGIYFTPDKTPEDKKCPDCGKPLTIGVLERAYELAVRQGGKPKLPKTTRRQFITMVPLIELIAVSMKKTHTSKPVQALYHKIVSNSPETEFWFMDEKTMGGFLTELSFEESMIEDILSVKKGNFSYFPFGYDGEYGKLVIGEKIDLNLFSSEGRI